MRAVALTLSLGVVLAACRDEAHPAPGTPVEPPLSSPEAIPDAPVSGRIHGAPFALRDARYVIDRRVGYAHTDIVLSAGTAEAACAPVAPRESTSVWLRMDGPGKIATERGRVGPGGEGTWRVHYQVHDQTGWSGVGEGAAVLVLHEPGPDGRLSGGLAVCFSDEAKSCVSGSFDALGCPPTIDQPVRGTPPPEAVPPQYLKRIEAPAPPAPAPSK